jgi:hypothetical protein
MDHPFIDCSELTDEELYKRIQKCQSYLYGEIQCGHAGMVDTIRAQLETYEFEFQERIQKQRMSDIEKRDKSGGVIEIGTISTVESDAPKEPEKRQKDL